MVSPSLTMWGTEKVSSMLSEDLTMQRVALPLEEFEVIVEARLGLRLSSLLVWSCEEKTRTTEKFEVESQSSVEQTVFVECNSQSLLLETSSVFCFKYILITLISKIILSFSFSGEAVRRWGLSSSSRFSSRFSSRTYPLSLLLSSPAFRILNLSNTAILKVVHDPDLKLIGQL